MPSSAREARSRAVQHSVNESHDRDALICDAARRNTAARRSDPRAANGLPYGSVLGGDPCAKCEGTVIATEYRATAMERNHWWHRGCFPYLCPRSEHLHRACETCGCEWVEATADTPPGSVRTADPIRSDEAQARFTDTARRLGASDAVVEAASRNLPPSPR